MSLTNKPVSEDTATKLSGNVPKGEGEFTGQYGGPVIDAFMEMGAASIASYKFPDGSDGFAIFSKAWAFHVDNNNNFIFTAGPPSQGGCGGKMIQKSEAIVQRTGSVSTHVTGRKDDGVTKQEVKNGGVEESKLPAYSLKVEGDILLESVGGEVVVKGDNITLNALNTLNLKSGKDINIQAGDQSGKITMNCSKFDLNAAFFNKDISGGEYSSGSGENKVEQYNPNATTEITTPGSIKYTVNGDYEVGVTGDYKQIVNGNYSLAVDKDYAQTIKGDFSTKVEGKAKQIFNGINKTSAQKETYILEVGVATKEIPSYLITSGSGIKFETTTDGFLVETAKQASKFEINEKELNASVGKKLGELSINAKESKLSYGETASISMTAADTRVKGILIYLN
jgi:hypothetical protein